MNLTLQFLITQKVKPGDDLPPPIPPKGKPLAHHVSPFVFVLFFVFLRAFTESEEDEHKSFPRK